MDVSRRFEVICIFMVFTLTTVNSIDQVTGDIGGDALLTCFYNGGDLPQKVTAYWRDKDDDNVLDIKDVPNYSSQNPKFSGRVTSFPDLYKKGNFSIVLTNLQKPDSGVYQCDILGVDYMNKVSLTVSDKYAEKRVTPRPTTTTTTATTAAATARKGASGAASVSLMSLPLTLLSVPLSLLLSP